MQVPLRKVRISGAALTWGQQASKAPFVSSLSCMSQSGALTLCQNVDETGRAVLVSESLNQQDLGFYKGS